MTRIFTLLLLSLCTFYSMSQAPPEGINYQAVAFNNETGELPGTDASMVPVKSKAIKVRFSILKDEIDGTEAFQEEHTTSTDESGLFDVIIGQGFQVGSAAFSDIDWSTGLHFLKVEIDISGEYREMGTQQLWSVPYALYTERAANGISEIVDNGDSTATFIFENGITYTTENMAGPQGADGNGITNTIDNGDGTLTFVYDDGSTFTTPNLEGPQGPAGAQGPTGPQGPQGPNGISLNWLGTFTSAPGSPALNDAYYNSNDGISYVWDGSNWEIIAQDGTSGGGGANTLDQAYDEGGAGAGRSITADNGAVEINNSGTNTTALSVNSPIANSFAIEANNSNTGVAIRGQNTNASNTFPAIQGETNSSEPTNSAILGQNTGAGYAVAGQIPATSSGTAAVYGNNLRTAGGSGVSGIGLNGVVGEATNGDGFGVYGNNPITGGGGVLAVGTYGIGFNGIYGQTTDATNGWAGYFTADVGIDGSVFAIGAGNFNLSDQRLKNDFASIPNALNKIMQLNGKHYTIATKHRLKGGEIETRERQEYGVIAQEVEALFPEMIEEKAIFMNTGDDTRYKAVNYNQLVPVLIEALKELKGDVDQLEQRIEALEENANN